MNSTCRPLGRGRNYYFVFNTFGTATSEPARLRVCSADFNCDGFINTSDFFDFIAAFLSPTACE